MKNTFLTLIYCFIILSICNAQQIEIKPTDNGYQFLQDGKELKLRHLERALSSNPESLSLIKTARSNRLFSISLAFVGGAFIGWPVGTKIAGKDPNWNLAAIGGGLTIIGVVVAKNIKTDAKDAVDMYNASLEDNSYLEQKSFLEIKANENGIGLSLIF